MVAVFAGLGVWFSAGSRHQPGNAGEWQDQTLTALSGLLSGREKFDAESPRVADLQEWLRANGAAGAAAAGLPAAVQRLASLGCKTVAWKGHPISIICFHGPGGELVHLAMVNRAALASPPPDGHPVFGERDGWRMAAWSQGDMSMMLVTRASESQLRTLFGIVELF